MSRDLGRAIASASASAAAASTSIRRGVVVEVLEGDRYVVELANGGRIKVDAAGGYGAVVSGASVSLSRSGPAWEIMGVSPWQGGSGAPASP